MIKIQMTTNHLEYKKGQIVELEDEQAVTLLTNGKALKIHRKTKDITTEKTEENSEEKITEKGNKKSKKNDQ
jgi:hypothetical protein